MRGLHGLTAALGAALIVLGLSSSSCAPREPVLGAVLPFSGAAERYGRSIREGMDLAVDEINREGGIGGQPLRIVYEDTGTDPEKGKAAARKLIEQDGVSALIGAVSSTVTLEIAQEVAGPAGVILLSPASSAPELTGVNPFFLRVYPSDTLEAARMADLIGGELRLRRLVVIAAADNYGSGYKKVFIERFKRRRNREVVKVHNFMPANPDFASIVAETRDAAPDGVLLIGYIDAVVELVKGLRTAGLTAPIFSSGSLTSEFPALAGAAGEGVIFSRPDFRGLGTPEKVKAFLDAYRSRTGSEPEDYAAYGYDAVRMLAQIMSLGSLDRRDIHLSLRSPASEYEGVTGRIVFGNEGDVIALPTTFIVHDGAILPYKAWIEQGGTPPGSDAGEEEGDDGAGATAGTGAGLQPRR